MKIIISLYFIVFALLVVKLIFGSRSKQDVNFYIEILSYLIWPIFFIAYLFVSIKENFVKKQELKIASRAYDRAYRAYKRARYFL